MPAQPAPTPAPIPPERSVTVLVMGVCGSGKTTLARQLAAALAAEFIEADAFHSTANAAKMSSGIALNDADRAGWLLDLNRALRDNAARGRAQVLACSALKEAYRTTLAEGLGELKVIHLEGSREVLAARLGVRHDHFMPLSLLDSQLEILERPRQALFLSLTLTPAQTLNAALQWLTHEA